MKQDSLTAHPRDKRGLSEKRIGWPIQTVQVSSASCRTATVDGAGPPAKFHNSFHDNLDDVISRLKRTLLPDTIA